MTTTYPEPDAILSFRIWFLENGGRIHEDLFFSSDTTGLAIRTRRELKFGVTVVSCPHNLAITIECARAPLGLFCGLSRERQLNLSHRQLICAYVGLHLVISEDEDETGALRHRPYINILPKAENLLTPLYFSRPELDIFKGTNLYGATLDQLNTWTSEHRLLRDAIAERSPNIAEKLTFEIYQLAATYLSSRAFPSGLLSDPPSLIASDSSYPILLPGIDAFNHKRGHAVTWGSSFRRASNARGVVESDQQQERTSCVSLTIDVPMREGEEVLNNYGPKPNSSLILSYGFTLPDNPDDTILLKIGSGGVGSELGPGARYEVGRNANGAEELWSDVHRMVAGGYDESSDGREMNESQGIQIDLETTETLIEMVSSLIARLPNLTIKHSASSVREEVRYMWKHYVKGQRDILEALLHWLEDKDKEAVRRAEELGINIVGEDSEAE